jgi:hypothetical protein
LPRGSGPPPKRTEERRRVNKPATPVTRAPGAPTVTIPDPDPGWHPAALRWWDSLAESGQSKWYEPSDWAMAWVTAELLSGQLKTVKRSSVMISAIWDAMGKLLITEADRRRLRIELERGDPEKAEKERKAKVTRMRDYHRAARSG